MRVRILQAQAPRAIAGAGDNKKGVGNMKHLTHTEFSRRGGRAGRGKSKARTAAQASAAGKKGAAVRWARTALELIESGDAIVGSTPESRRKAAAIRNRIAGMERPD